MIQNNKEFTILEPIEIEDKKIDETTVEDYIK